MPVSRGVYFYRKCQPKVKACSKRTPQSIRQIWTGACSGKVDIAILIQAAFQLLQSDFTLFDYFFYPSVKGDSLHVYLSTASVALNLNDLVTSSDCWNFGSSGPCIKVLDLSELDRVEQRRGRKNRSVAIRYQNGGVYLSGVMSLVHTDTILDELLLSEGGTTTPKGSLKRSKIGRTEIAVLITFGQCDPRISGAFFSCLLSCP